MGKLPFMQFYPADWLQDTQILSLEAQGAWMKILCALHIASERGRKTWYMRELKHFLGYPDDDRAIYLLNALNGVATIDARDEDGNLAETFQQAHEITIISRRMVRDEAERIKELERKRRYEEKNPTRHRRASDAHTTRILQKSEVRSHTSEEEEEKIPAQLPKAAWPADDLWLLELLKKQNFLEANGYLHDYEWWNNVSQAVNGIEPEFLEREFAKMGAWLRENPQRMPTTKGMRRFIRTWVEKAKEHRRFDVVKR
jgi:uncharacterized protein YdaU (DUF1376 family)